MKILDTLLGRTKPVKPNLDALFSLPSAAVTLQVSAGLVPTGRAGVCFKPPSGQAFADMQKEIEQLLDLPEDADDAGGTQSARIGSRQSDRCSGLVRLPLDRLGGFGDRRSGHPGPCCPLLTRRRRMGNAAPLLGVRLRQEGTSSLTTTSVYIVYLAKRGTFYPFAPTGKEQRDTELELSLRATIGSGPASRRGPGTVVPPLGHTYFLIGLFLDSPF